MARSAAESLPLPPQPRTREGAMRRVGVELELGGMEIQLLSRIVASQVGGAVEPLSRYEHRVVGDPRGPWAIELDFTYLKNRGREERISEGVWGQLDEAAEDLLRAGSEQLVPMEIVSPPLPMDELAAMDALIERLRDAGGRGTRDGLAFAFGLHFNPELPDLDAATVLRYLQAFLCLFDWLKMRARVDLTRRLTLFVDPFPLDYVRKLMAPDYAPDMATLIDDYLDANPTRNRALDMLPLFAHLDEGRVQATVRDLRVKPRPTLHYRLPNSEVDSRGWGIGPAWRDWLEVEYLTAEPDRLANLRSRYLALLERPLGRLLEDWAEQVRPWLRFPDGR